MTRPQYRQDSVTGEWVVIAAARADRPIEFESPAMRKPGRECPFCPGNERATPAATFELTDGRSAEWQVRIVQNLFPAFDAQFTSDTGLSNGMPAVGLHEVIIESPRHVSRLTELTDMEIDFVFEAYRQRLDDFAADRRIAFGLLFKNCGHAAGISLEHIHSQLVGLPIVPPVVKRELQGARDKWAADGCCVYCEIVANSFDRIVQANDEFIALCPFASRFPYETWILPQQHSQHFYQEPSLSNLGRFVRRTLSRLERRIPGAAYNVVLHSSPFDGNRYDYYHWHIEIIPRIATVAGLEWGGGIHVNVIPPELAARELADQQIEKAL